MPFLSFGQGLSKNLSGENVPEDQKFPAGTLIPYYGNTPVLPGWSRYSRADNRLLYGGQPGNQSFPPGYQKSAQLLTVSFGGSVASAGTHTGPTTYQNLYSTGIYTNAQTLAGGSHFHTITGGGSAQSIGVGSRQRVTFLVADRSHATLPTNSLVIKQTAATNSVAFSRAGSNFLMGADNNQTYTPGGSITYSVAPQLNSNGYHTHPGTGAGKRFLPAGQRFYAYQMSGTTGQYHNHTMAARTFTQSEINHILVNLWQAIAPLRTSTDVIVPYVGLNNPPTPWYYCDGTNGTVDLRLKVVGYSENQWMVTKVHNATGTVDNIVSTASVGHDHTATYVGADLAASSYTGIVNNAQHRTYNWVHAHTAGVTNNITPFVPALLYVNFIQYKG